MIFNTYRDIEERIKHLTDLIKGLREEIKNKEKNLSKNPAQNITDIKRDEELIAATEKNISEIQKIQNAYNLIDKNITEIKNFKLNNLSDYKSGIDALDKLRKEINEAIELPDLDLKLPNKLIDEILKKHGISRDYFDKIRVETKDKTNKYPEVEYYKNEFDKLEKEVADILGGRDINEISISELDSIYKKYEAIKEKKVKLKNKFDVDLMDNLEIFSEKEINEILDINKSFDEGLEAKQKSAKNLKENKEKLKIEFEEEVVAIKENIDLVKKQISIYEDEIRELEKNHTENQFEIIGRRSKIDELKKYIDLKNDKIKEINDDIDRLENGGIIKNAPSKEEKIDLEKEFGIIMGPKPLAPTPAAPTPTPAAPIPTPSALSPIPAAPTPTPSAPAPAAELPNTLENLVNKGIVPRLNYMRKADLLSICKELGIDVKDTTTVLTNEQVERLKNDHELQSAVLNQRIFDRNKEKIAKYDELIAKYQTILDSKLDIKTFTPEYIAKVQELHDKLEHEKANLEAKNKKITAFDHSEIYKNEGHMIDENYEATLSTRNDKLKGEYKKVDDLREESKKAHSKFKQRSIERNINRTLAKIKELQSKNGKIASRQTEIINKNSEKYINKIASKYSKHLAKQNKLEQSVDNVIAISERLNSSKVEKNLVEQERREETKLFDRIGLGLEDRRLEKEIKRLESDMKLEEKSVGRMR